MSFNDTHPELKEGEVFVTNSFLSEEGVCSQPGDDSHFSLQLNTKRVGHTAYDINGKRIQGAVPVFAKKDEYEENKHRLWSEKDLQF